MLRTGLRHRRNVEFGHQQKMHRRPRVDVMKTKNLIVFINDAAGNLAGNDFAKQAIIVADWR